MNRAPKFGRTVRISRFFISESLLEDFVDIILLYLFYFCRELARNARGLQAALLVEYCLADKRKLIKRIVTLMHWNIFRCKV